MTYPNSSYRTMVTPICVQSLPLCPEQMQTVKPTCSNHILFRLEWLNLTSNYTEERICTLSMAIGMNDDRTVFKRVDMDLSSLLHYIDLGDIGLPDIQRPFVWSSTKVRDLFDSMYQGFPVGYLLFWANPSRTDVRQIGLSEKAHNVPSLLIIDGQQRLTSLYSVFRGKSVKDGDYREKRIEIAFCPANGTFEVCDAAIRKDPEYIPDISAIWADGRSSYSIIKDFLQALSEKRDISGEEEEKISHNLDRLFDLQKYPFTALEIASSVDEEQVADIFVRINSQGVTLNQADFILTLLSVFGEDLRKELEDFCFRCRFPATPGMGPSPYNHFIQPSPDQLLRVSVALAFSRGRLKSVYQVLRGKDLTTGEYSDAKRDEQFAKLRKAQRQVLDLTNWHQFFASLVGAGFRSGDLISSQTSLIYTYVFYILGRHRFNLPQHVLDRLIPRWFYAVILSGRYTGSPESVMDGDLNLIKDLNTAEEFVQTLEGIITNTLTSDFWQITIPNNLVSSSTRHPLLFAFYAAQIKLKTPVLFSNKYLADLMDPTIQAKKKFIDRHHLFPRAWLEREGVTDMTRINQIANLAFVEWPDNIRISDMAPADYVTMIRRQKLYSDDEWRAMHAMHALPEDWEHLPYQDFLEQRRKLMAAIIRQGFEAI